MQGACETALNQFVTETIARVQQTPGDPIDTYVTRLRTVVASCGASRQLLDKPVCGLALNEAVSGLAEAAIATKDKTLPGPEAAALRAAQLQAINAHREFCVAPQSLIEQCSNDLDVAAFWEWQRHRKAGDSPDEAAKHDAELAKLKTVCDGYLDRQSVLAQIATARQTARLDEQICAHKEQILPAFLQDYYARRDDEGDEPENRLTIDEVRFGDLKHGHTCDATGYVVRRCAAQLGAIPASSNDTEGMAGASFCLIRRPDAASASDATLRVDMCGYDPSPQADLDIKIKYSCGGAKRELRRLPGDTRKIDIVCALPTTARAYRAATADNLKKELDFLVNPPCPIPQLKPKT